MLEGSSVTEEMVNRVKPFTEGKNPLWFALIPIIHMNMYLAELNFYAPFVTPGSYIVVFDTIVEDLPERYLPNRFWSIGNNPKTAVKEFLKIIIDFEIDETMDNKLLISVNPRWLFKKNKMIDSVIG